MRVLPTALIVDDDPIARDLMADALAKSGFEVRAVADAGSAFQALSAGGVPQLFVVDYVLPGLNGLDFIRAVREDPRAVDSAIVLVTGVQDRATGIAALQLGADDFLFKPLDLGELALRCRSVVERRSGPAAPGHERRDLAVLFADVRGFTPLTERIDPETSVTILNDLFETLDRAVEAEGGYVDKFMGDSLLALFGARGAPERNELRACRAALAMQSLARRFADDSLSLASHAASFGIGVGVACGQAVVGAVGTRKKRTFTAIGDPVNLAARLQGMAERDEVVIDGEVASRLGSGARLSAPREIAVKGKEKPRVVYRLLGLE